MRTRPSAIAKVGGWELEIETGNLNWTDETFKILEVEKRIGQSPHLEEGLKLFIPEHQPIIERAVNRAIEHGEPYFLELKAQTAKGNVLWVYTNGQANYKNGKVVSLSGTIQDINEKKLAQEKLEEEQLKSIQQSRLASLGEISTGIVHEINNPLTVILTSLPLMEHFRNHPEKFQQRIASLEKAGRKIEKIIGNLKRFVHQSAEPEQKDFSLNEIIHEVLEITTIKAKKSGTQLTNSISAEVQIHCTPLQIEQVLVNLINNAVDAVQYSAEKWVRLELEESQSTISINILDSGPGIPNEIKDKLFDAFITTKPAGEGTGLGLSISKGIIESHHGELQHKTIDGVNCFSVILPKVNIELKRSS